MICKKRFIINFPYPRQTTPGHIVIFSLSQSLFHWSWFMRLTLMYKRLIGILKIVKSAIDIKCFCRWRTWLWETWLGSNNIIKVRLKRFNFDRFVLLLSPRGFWPNSTPSWSLNCIRLSRWDIVDHLVLPAFCREHNFPHIRDMRKRRLADIRNFLMKR